jgi:Arc/MetJ family transcription regulator
MDQNVIILGTAKPLGRLPPSTCDRHRSHPHHFQATRKDRGRDIVGRKLLISRSGVAAMRTVIDLDDEALADAAAELGTTTKVATVNEALRLAAARRRTAAYLDLLAELDLGDDDRSQAWHAA